MVMEDKFRGADYSFNNQWTIVQSQRDRRGRVTAWELLCGCGHESAYKIKDFLDAYATAIISRDYHCCVEPLGIESRYVNHG
jgi:hypothetical protein